MSRGLGRVERRILELLEEVDNLPAAKIAWVIAGQAAPTLALAASIRRALGSLQKKGRVVRVQGRGWMLEDKWQRCEDRARQEEASRRENLEREHVSKEAWAREKVDAERRTGGEDDHHASAARCAPRYVTDVVADTARLVKVLGLFASAHDGEVLGAARQAEQIRRRLGREWDELIFAHNLFGKPATPFGEKASSDGPQKQDDVDRAVDAFQQAMGQSTFWTAR